jgi:hypothetical protein
LTLLDVCVLPCIIPYLCKQVHPLHTDGCGRKR